MAAGYFDVMVLAFDWGLYLQEAENRAEAGAEALNQK